MLNLTIVKSTNSISKGLMVKQGASKEQDVAEYFFVQFFLLELQSKALLGTLSLTLVTFSSLKVFPHTWGQIY